MLNRLLPVVLYCGGPYYRRHHKSCVRWLEERACAGAWHRDRFRRAPGSHCSRHHNDDSITHGAGDEPSGPGPALRARLANWLAAPT